MQTAEGQAVAPYRQPVSPVVADNRPYWSVMIPTYNCAAFLGEALRSVLAQDQGGERMQIEVIDDGSSDDPGAVVSDLGGGRVVFHRQPENVGHIRNFQSCLERSHGRIVHILHGDDAVAPGFYEALEAGFVACPEIGAAFCRTIFMDENGRRGELSEPVLEQAGLVPAAVETLARTQVIMTPSIAVRRVVYERLGGFDSRLECSEDWIPTPAGILVRPRTWPSRAWQSTCSPPTFRPNPGNVSSPKPSIPTHYHVWTVPRCSAVRATQVGCARI
jgi:cellulose synthase/poly-beta-1,6-N-acetylglucosamine synthase-like glycosyltransferase